jgi:NADPH-dependent curcumin reductase CurA
MDDDNRLKIRFRGRRKDQPVEEDASSTVKLAHRGVVPEAETELLGRCRFLSWNPTQTLRIS